VLEGGSKLDRLNASSKKPFRQHFEKRKRKEKSDLKKKVVPKILQEESKSAKQERAKLHYMVLSFRRKVSHVQ